MSFMFKSAWKSACAAFVPVPIWFVIALAFEAALSALSRLLAVLSVTPPPRSNTSCCGDCCC